MVDESLPLVSIVVPSFNQGHFISDTISSILNQDYQNIEIVIVDGASTDSTIDVLEFFKDQIEYVSEADNGQSDAINKGFRMVDGDIVAWLNSDDIYPDRRAISRMVEAFLDNPEWDFIYGNFIEIDSDNHVLKIFRRPRYSHARLLRIGYISQPATFFRRAVIEAMQVKQDLRYAMDLEYWLRAHSHNFTFGHVNFLVAAERLHEDAKCVRDNRDMVREASSVRSMYGAKFDRNHSVRRFMDRILLYFLRLPGIVSLLSYRRSPDLLTIPLTFEGAIKRTLLFRKL